MSLNDEELIGTAELLSDGTEIIFSEATVVSTTTGTKVVVLSGVDLFREPEQLEESDKVTLSGTSPDVDGEYTVDEVLSTVSFSITEAIGTSTGGTCTAKYPTGARKVGFDAEGQICMSGSNVQDAVVSLHQLMRAYSQATGELTGFLNRTDSELSFIDGTRTFTIQPAVSTYSYYIEGVEYEKTGADNVVISDVEGFHYIYFDGTTLTETTASDIDLLYVEAYVGAIYWNATDNVAIYIGDERHGVVMDWRTHAHLHLTLGTAWVYGLALTGMVVDGDGSSDTHAQLGYDLGKIRDEDLDFAISADSSPAQIPVFYRSGSAGYYRKFDATNFPLRIYNGTGGNFPAWNQWTGSTWQQTQAESGQYILMHLFATNSVVNPVIAVQGREKYVAYFVAQFGAASEINEIIKTGFPFLEVTPLGSILLECDVSYTNSIKSRIISLAGEDYADWRGISRASIGQTAEGVSQFGSQLAYDNDSSESSSSSTTYQTKLTLNLGGIPTGAYRVGFQTEWQYSTTSRSIDVRIELDDTVSIFETSVEPKDPADWNVLTGFFFLSIVEGDHYIDIDWRCERNNDLSKLRSTRIEFWRVG